MRRACLIVLSLAIATPALAQNTTDRRAFELQERMRNLGQNQRVDDVSRRLSDLELRRRTDENLQALQQGRSTISEPYPVTPAYSSPTPPPSAYDQARDAELKASNDRLRAMMTDR